jgi:hypothetical protein
MSTPWTFEKEPETKVEQGEFEARIFIRKEKLCGWLSRSEGLSTRAYFNDCLNVLYATSKITASPIFISH